MRLYRFLPDFGPSTPPPDDTAYLILGGAPALPSTLGARLHFLTAVEGRIEIRAGQRTIVLERGDYVILPAGQPATVQPSPASRGRLFVVGAPRQVRGDFFEDTRHADEFISPLLENLYRAVEGGRSSRRQAESTVEALLRAAAERDAATRAKLAELGAERAETRDDHFRRIQRAREFMDARCGELPTAAHAAQIACMSVAHFHRRFALIVGETPHRYLTRRRLQEARTQLRDSRVSIARLGQSLGFECPWTLSALFRRAYGVTPTQFRDGLAAA